MAGSVDILQRCYTGIEFHEDLLYLHPRIPYGLPKLTMRIKFRGNWLRITATPRSSLVTCEPGSFQVARVQFQSKKYELSPGEMITLLIEK